MYIYSFKMEIFMKKSLLSFVAVSLLMSFAGHVLAEEKSASVKSAAYAKTAFDILSFPIVLLVTTACVGKAIKPGLTSITSDFLDADIAKWVSYATGMGIGALTGMGSRALYVKLHKAFGFTDEEINQVCAESFEQKAWIAAQVGPILLLLKEYYDAKARAEREKREREQRLNNRPTIVIL